MFGAFAVAKETIHMCPPLLLPCQPYEFPGALPGECQ